jgi:hypothetical protein
MTNTSFSAEDPSRAFAPLVMVMRPFMRKPERGADTPVFLASSGAVDGVSGEYFANRTSKKTNPTSYNTADSRRLWEVSADLVGISATSLH